MQILPRVLENGFLRLEPLAPEHAPGLRAACDADPDTWNRLYSFSMLGEAFDASWAKMQEDTAAGRSAPFAVCVEGVCVGMTGLHAIEPQNRAVECGGTYYAPQVRGGFVNAAAKRLLLGFAFESGAERVHFRVDATNARSRAAVLKLGAVQEGVLRHDRIVWTGRVRDTVVFSILSAEWPAVRARLDARLAGPAAP